MAITCYNELNAQGNFYPCCDLLTINTSTQLFNRSFSITHQGKSTVAPLLSPLKLNNHQNVTFPSGIGANRGLKLVLGGQVQGMRMSTILNNTRVRNILDCSANTTVGIIGCQGASGSVYSTADSSFQQVFNLQDWNVTYELKFQFPL